ncbi:MAG: YigZ family protein [Bacilli bacterium]|nr:YigZ family protein [Bacilli bacterium]
MKTISKNIENEIIINKSRFICKLVKVYSEEDVMNALNSAKEEYKDATHYCYSYIIDNTERFNDDGEPGGTAGMPILNVLKQNELNYVLCIVIRYFGGIKLGAGGLVRAYTKSTSECLNNSTLKELKIGFSIKILFDYDKVKLIDYTLNNIDIKDKTFEDKITYTFDISNENYDKIKEILSSNCNEISISDNILIEE